MGFVLVTVFIDNLRIVSIIMSSWSFIICWCFFLFIPARLLVTPFCSVAFCLNYETIGTAATPGLLCQPRVIMKMICGEHDGM
jgi:hypothetical protein